jgi:hypothetical protein
MTTIEIIQLIRLGISAATSIGLDIADVKQRMDANGGDLSEADVEELLAESQTAINQL